MNPFRNLILSLSALSIVILIGTVGYHVIEHWAFFDALYMTIITLATVGFREVHDLSPEGQLFTMGLIICGTGLVAYAAGSVIQIMVEGQLRHILGRKKVQQQVAKLTNHYIICGYGRIGHHICQAFTAKPVPFVVVEKDAEICDKLYSDGVLFVRGDATDDDCLVEAGIMRAKGLITVVTSDTDNVYITLTARGLKPDLFILARSGDKSVEKKLLRAGATKVISPYTIGASRMAQAVLRPSVVDFIEIATTHHNLELQMEEIVIHSESDLVGKTIMSSDVRSNYGIIIVAIKKSATEKMVFNPSSQALLEANDILITLGESQSIKALELRANGTL
ncbi:MAG: potassium channel protein [Desulfuromonadaceae bacterium]|nr:potassium channel protein [Desulfuromonadaceae bacterium]